MSAHDRNFLEAVLEGAEAAIDFATESEAVKSVPIIGTAIKLVKGFDDLRSKALQAKLHKFATEPSLVHSLETRRFLSTVKEDEHYQKIGETLFLTLDKVTDLQKPVVLAQVFAAYLDGVVNAKTLLLLAHAIDTAFISDLEQFLDGRNDQVDDPEAGIRLLTTGLLQVVEFKLTPLGRNLRAAVQHARARHAP